MRPTEMKLIAIKEYKGRIVLKSGLHIGSGNMEMHIGGTDSPVIRHPHSLEPYIPGSSLKGKTRSLLEMQSGLIRITRGEVISPKYLEQVTDEKLSAVGETILKLFGAIASDQNKAEDITQELGPTRVSFADCYLNRKWLEKAKSNRWPLTEEKSENCIDRVRGVAQHPRFIERVPEGAEFDFYITVKVLGENEGDGFEETLLKGMRLVTMDAIGGSGSRGYGRIEFKFDDEEVQKKFDGIDPFAESSPV